MEANNGRNMKIKEKYKIRKTIYILLIILMILNLVFIFHGDGHYIPNNNQINNNNENIINNGVIQSNIKNEENKENNIKVKEKPVVGKY